jgi:hypothetical protein
LLAACEVLRRRDPDKRSGYVDGSAGETVMRIYVASSWRNQRQPSVVEALQGDGHDVYDFRHPSTEDAGFHWSEIDPKWESWSPAEFRDALQHPLAVSAFGLDMAALPDAEIVVLVLPCGRSAHLEFGHAVGSGAYGLILLADGKPELTYRMADRLCLDLDELRKAVQELECQKESTPVMGVRDDG